MSSIPDHSLDGESKSELMIGLSAGLGFLCTLVVTARLYTRCILLRNAGLDDLMILVTQIVGTAMNIATCLEAHYGVGRHSWLASTSASASQLKCLFSAIQTYIWALCLVKVSLLLQYRRLFPAAWLQRSALVITTFACTWNIVQSVLVSFACVPMSILFPAMAGSCIDSLTVWYIAAGINITTDFIVFLLPIPLINSLQLPFRQKSLLIAVFCLGFFTCIISIVRATTLKKVVLDADPSWYGTEAAIWSMVEVNCAILCASLPTIRHLLALVLPWLGLQTQQPRYLDGASCSAKGTGLCRAPRFGSASDHEAAAGVEFDTMARWGGVDDKGGAYHSSTISAWAVGRGSGRLHEEPALGRASSSCDGASESGLVSPSLDHQRKGSSNVPRILVTKQTVIEESRADSPQPGSPSRAV